MSVETHPGHVFLRALRDATAQQIAYEGALSYQGESNLHDSGQRHEEAAGRLAARAKQYTESLDDLLQAIKETR